MEEPHHRSSPKRRGHGLVSDWSHNWGSSYTTYSGLFNFDPQSTNLLFDKSSAIGAIDPTVATNNNSDKYSAIKDHRLHLEIIAVFHLIKLVIHEPSFDGPFQYDRNQES